MDQLHESRIGVLFVCTGNICRSPTAEGVFRGMVEAEGLADRIVVDSAAVENWHPGKQPDARSQLAARRAGYDLSGQRARVLTTRDFVTFDYLVAMDHGHRLRMERLARSRAERKKVSLLLRDYAPQLGEDEVPDPYYSGEGVFGFVLEMIEEGAAGLLAHLRERRLPGEVPDEG